MARPEVSLIVCTYQMPGHLRRVLASIARQTVVQKLEILVTDDGSTDETPQLVREFSQASGLAVGFLTHRHEGFHLTRCRNDGARIASAPYLLFLDGDCIIPPNHVEQYLAARQPNTVHFGYCYRLPEETSARIHEPAIAAGQFVDWAPRSEWWKLAKLHAKSLFYEAIGHRTKPALKGGNIGIWRSDYERLNGFDENFRAWGCEDDDLSYRVRAAGLRVSSILGRTRTYHLWHPPATTKPVGKWSEGENVAYLKRRGRLTCCTNGLKKRQLSDLRVQIAGKPEHADRAALFMKQVFGTTKVATEAEVELLFHPGRGEFSPSAECKVLVAANPLVAPESLQAKADIVLPEFAPRARELLAKALHIPSVSSDAARSAA